MATPAQRCLLTVNGGSSSIRFAVFEAAASLRRLYDGKIERIGGADATMSAGRVGQAPDRHAIEGGGPDAAVDALMKLLDRESLQAVAVGHRVVHGMRHAEPERVTPALLQELKSIIPYDPEHLPRELELIERFQHELTEVPQVVCFDTAFHRTMPERATRLPIPRRFGAQGVQRYGFHGLSYTYLMQALGRLPDPAASTGKIILAHLGSGASLAAVLDGRCIDTSMGFTPTAGLVMGTRSGDLDPGLMSFLLMSQGMSAAQFQTMVNHESGLLGISESSADVRDLLEREATDSRAREALDAFCYQAKKWIGSYAAALGGLDTLVFAGGIGENAPVIRQRICQGLEFLGLRIDSAGNDANADCISSAKSTVTVRVIHTDEESVIAELTAGLLGLS